MDQITNYFASQGVDFWNVIKSCGILLTFTAIFTVLAKLIFGKDSVMNSAVSSAIGILFIYSLEIISYTFPNNYSTYIPPLPFVTLSQGNMTFLPLLGQPYAIVCSQLLSMIILAFVMNIIDELMPKGKNFFVWLILRIITVLGAIFIHHFVYGLLNKVLPDALLLYAPTILFWILIALLLTGALKVVVGALMATVNPVIAALYTFFFASLIGKQITKAIFTAGLMAGLVILLQKTGTSTIPVAPAALITYIPFAAVLIPMWYVVHREQQ